MEKKVIKTGINVNGNVMIFKDKNGNFGTTLGRKLEDDTWDNKRIPLTFAGGTPKELRHKDIIEIQGFLSFFRTRTEEEVITVIVMDYKLLD